MARGRLDGLFAFLAGWVGRAGYRGSYVMTTAAELATVATTLNPDAAREARSVIEAHQRREHALLVELTSSAQVSAGQRRSAPGDGLADELQLICVRRC